MIMFLMNGNGQQTQLYALLAQLAEEYLGRFMAKSESSNIEFPSEVRIDDPETPSQVENLHSGKNRNPSLAFFTFNEQVWKIYASALELSYSKLLGAMHMLIEKANH